MTTLNSGLLFQRKYESDANAVRRFLIANEGVSNLTYKSLYSMTASRHSFIQLVKERQSDLYWLLNKWLIRENWRDASIESDSDGLIEINEKKQCPICAKEVFHSHLFSFCWATTCPIHGVELTSTCPECGKPWGFPKKYSRNDCTTCGTTRPKSLKKRKSQLRGHTKKEIKTLDAFWSFTQFHSNFANVLYYDYADNGCSTGITFGSKEFPNLAATIHSKYIGLFQKVGVSTSTLSMQYFSGAPVNIEDFKLMPSDNVYIFREYVAEAIHEIDREIRIALKLPNNKKYKSLTSEYVYPDRIDDYNEKVVSYTIWKILTDEALSEKLYITWWMRIFSILGIPYPETPPIVHLVYSEDFKQIIEPTNEFRKWMYKNSLVNLFIYIYKHTLLLKNIVKGTSQLRKEDISEGRRYVWSPCYTSFRVKILGNQRLQVFYQPFPPWAEITKVSNLMKVYNNTPYFDSFSQSHESTHWKNTFGRSLKANRLKNLYKCLVKGTA